MTTITTPRGKVKQMLTKKFHFSSYWRTWSRVIGQEGYETVELNLTPINPGMKSSWERNKLEIFRAHSTARDKKDIETDELPSEVVMMMEKAMGEELTNKLINFDYLAHTTLKEIIIKNRIGSGGGVEWLRILG